MSLSNEMLAAAVAAGQGCTTMKLKQELSDNDKDKVKQLPRTESTAFSYWSTCAKLLAALTVN